MLRQVFIKIDGEARSSSPKTCQWAGMQYEDNATEVVREGRILNTGTANVE